VRQHQKREQGRQNSEEDYVVQIADEVLGVQIEAGREDYGRQKQVEEELLVENYLLPENLDKAGTKRVSKEARKPSRTTTDDSCT